MHYLRIVTCTVVLVLLLYITGILHAHDPGLSTAELNVAGRQITAHLIFARRDIEALVTIDVDQDGSVTTEEFDAACPQLQVLAGSAIKITVDGQHVTTQSVKVELDQSDALHFLLNYPEKTCSRLNVSMPIITKLSRWHRQYISVRDKKEEFLITERMLSADNPAFELDLLAETVTVDNLVSFQRFFILGIEHIVTGYDHLLFLFGLLIVCSNLWSTGKVITSFTIAHSITLALATFNFVNLPADFVEPLIAISIMYVGLENLFRQDLHYRWLLTFGFGLIHGLGFATVLRDLGIGANDSREVVMPLLAFNFGIEFGQITIALLVIPMIWKSQKLQNFQRFATTCSVLITFVGTYWLFGSIILN